MQLNDQNYYSVEADNEYMSCSLLQMFMECEGKAMGYLKGNYTRTGSDAMLLGNYVHSWAEGKSNEFLTDHPEMFKKNGTLYEKFAIGDEMIDAIKASDMSMYYLQGAKEAPLTAEMFGLKWKVKLDVLNDNWIADLKTTKSFTDRDWKNGKNVSFIDMYDYMMRAAVYSEVERIASGREEMDWKKFMLVVVSKESPPQTVVIQMNDNERYQEELERVKTFCTRIKLLKMGALKPIHCMDCDYCKSIRKQKRVLSIRDYEAGRLFDGEKDIWEVAR